MIGSVPASSGAPPLLPEPRGPVSAAVVDALRHRPGAVELPPLPDGDALADDDLQLALTCCYELHYHSFAGVDPHWEWSPSLLGVRRLLEQSVERGLFEEVGEPTPLPQGEVATALEHLAHAGTGPSLSRWMLEHGSREEMREFCVHRSAYQLKEADPHTWALPRIRGRAKAAMADIQHDEYGAGDCDGVHAQLFASTLRALGLDDRYGAYLDVIPGTTLATLNLISLFGLHRRWRGACVGHLALFEMTSVAPMKRYAHALERLGVGPEGRRFYDVHVEADAVHEVVALHDMVVPLVSEEPELAGDVLFGARALNALEQRFTRSLLEPWASGRSSLLEPLPSECGQGHRAATRASAIRFNR
jgi:hypothetical protein